MLLHSTLELKTGCEVGSNYFVADSGNSSNVLLLLPTNLELYDTAWGFCA